MPHTIILFGKSGSGKGTQAELLVKKFDLHLISTGELLREFAKRDMPIARKWRELMHQGQLAPMWLVFSLWLHELENLGSDKGVLFEGAARRLPEAKLLEEVLEWYDRKLQVFYIELSDGEVMKRLLLRKRLDDTETAIRQRLSWFSTDVTPVIEYYSAKAMVTRINGEQSPQKVHEDIVKNLAQ